MHIVCEKCQAKYIFPDEKIVKNVVRFTCQKCGHVITTRVEAVPSSDTGVLGKWRAAGGTAPERTKDDSPIWYYSYNGSSNGPFTESELLIKFSSEKLSPVAKYCYVWQKAFSEWKPAVEVEPFASSILMPPPPPAPPAKKSELDGNLPPLFNDLTGHTSAQSNPKQSSPDLAGLKQKLKNSSPSISKTASNSHPEGSPQETDKKNTTSSLQSGPLPSFQSLDAIAPAGKIESEDGNKTLKKPLPTVSKLPAIKPISTIGTKSSGQLPTIKPTATKSSLDSQATKSTSLPKLNAFKSSADTPAIAIPRISSSASLPIVNTEPKKPEASDDLDNIDLNITSGSEDIMGSALDDLPDIDLMQSGQHESISRTSLKSIDLEKDTDDEHEPQKLISAADMFAIVGQSKASLKTVTESSTSSDDIAEIDLDDEDSEFFTKEEIDKIKDQPSTDGILSNSEDLFADSDENLSNNVAHVSLTKLDEIQAKHADLFSELAEDQTKRPSDDSVSENSMLIQLEHFNKIQKKSKNTSRIILIAVIAAIVVISIGSIILSQTLGDNDNTPYVKTEDQATADHTPDAFGNIAGRTISSDELDETLVPQVDFEILAVETTPTTHKTHHSKSGTTKNSNSDKNQDEPDLNDDNEDTQDNLGTKSNHALDSLYGTNNDKEEDEIAQPTTAAVKNDGRANVVLKRDEFASTQGVQGTKYQINAGGMPSSREQFTIGLKNVSKSVQECHKREAKTGSMLDIQKVYIQLTVEPSGVVENFKVEEKSVPESFSKCLESKKGRWTFAPFEGDAVKMRQGFVLN